jgi:hypothetical protein
VAEIPLRHPRRAPAPLPWLLGAFWRAATAGALALALGVGVGLGVGPVDGERSGAATGTQVAASNGAADSPAQLAEADTPSGDDAQQDAQAPDELDELMALALAQDLDAEDWP